jgi:predicted transcriptional regulator
MISKERRYHNHEMVSFEKTALVWGQELFNYYRDISEQITELKLITDN